MPTLLPKETKAQRDARWRYERLQSEYMKAADLMEEKRMAWLIALDDYRLIMRNKK